VDLSADIEVAQEMPPKPKQCPVPRPPVETPPSGGVMPILPGQIVPATAGNQHIEDRVEAAAVIGPRTSHHALSAHFVGNPLPLLIGNGDFHAANF
jgi:hypothetical protein